EVDAGRRTRETEGGVIPRRLYTLRRREQRFRGHAAIVETVAAHPAMLEEHGRGTELRGARRHEEAARPRADHAEIGLDRLRHDCFFQRLYATGTSASTPRPISGSRMCG